MEYASNREVVKTFGINKTFRTSMEATMAGGYRYEYLAWEKLHAWVIRHWDRWVPTPMQYYHAVHHGGGPHWPNKVLGIKSWGDYCHQHQKEHGQ